MGRLRNVALHSVVAMQAARILRLPLPLAVSVTTGWILASQVIGNKPQTPASVAASALEYHKHLSRGQANVEPALTRAAAAHRDPTFHASLSGPIFAPPLFWAAANPGEPGLLLVASLQSDVLAVDASAKKRIYMARFDQRLR